MGADLKILVALHGFVGHYAEKDHFSADRVHKGLPLCDHQGVVPNLVIPYGDFAPVIRGPAVRGQGQGVWRFFDQRLGILDVYKRQSQYDLPLCEHGI